MEDEIVSYRKKDIIKVLTYLEMMVVSLDRIGSYYEDCETVEEYNALSSNFLDDWKVLPKLAKVRYILDEPFSSEVGNDDMDELEREFQDLEFWSLKKPLPSKK
jgi:hypothetical protein